MNIYNTYVRKFFKNYNQIKIEKKLSYKYSKKNKSNFTSQYKLENFTICQYW